jgi:hypothetical protein
MEMEVVFAIFKACRNPAELDNWTMIIGMS